VLTFTLTEAQRSLMIPFSGSKGGDAGASLLQVTATAFQDVATNEVAQVVDFTITEADDDILVGASP
jgi:hypothetical protein